MQYENKLRPFLYLVHTTLPDILSHYFSFLVQHCEMSPAAARVSLNSAVICFIRILIAIP